MRPKTCEEVRESHGVEDAWEVDAVQIVKDVDGECWIGPDREDAGLGLLFDSREDEFLNALESAGVLEASDRREPDGDGPPDEWETVGSDDPFEVYETGDGSAWMLSDFPTGSQYVGIVKDEAEELQSALREAGVLPDADADASLTGESADVTPVTDVGGLCAGDRVTATDGGGTSQTGTLESVEVNLNPMNNPYHVEFSDGSRWYAVHVEPAADADNDESRSPEDVAERWLKATDGTGKTAWAPVNESLSVGVTERGNLDLESGDMVTPVSHKSDQWYAKDVDRLEAADVPSEVPADD